MNQIIEGIPRYEIPEIPDDIELPDEDGEPLESNWHRAQINLLIDVVYNHWRDRNDFFAGGNMFISPSTRHEDLGKKKTLYEQTFKTRDYFCYDPETEELSGWTLGSDGAYYSLEADENGRLWSSELEAWIGLWQGKYLEMPDLWLRLFDMVC